MAMVGTRVAVVGRTVNFTAMAVCRPERYVSSLRTQGTALPLNSSSPCSISHPSFSAALAPLVCRFSARRKWNSSMSFCTSPTSPASVSVETSEPAPKEPQPITRAELDALDIRVGKVVKAWKHPEADSLYVEEVDLAEAEGPRTICSGLVKYLTLSELEGRDVLVLANLKPRNMRGVKSNGMLLAASNAEHTIVQLLQPPEGAAPGERVWFGSESEQSEQAAAATPNQLAKKKIWEIVQPLLRTTEECVAECESKPMRTSAGVVRCQSLQGASIA